MPTKFLKGDMFATQPELNGTVIEAYCHGSNCIGVMGAGVALLFKRKYPAMYKEYHERCIKGEFFGGDCMTYNKPKLYKQVIFNMFSQEKPGPNASYEWLQKSFQKMVVSAKLLGITKIAMPLIGAGIGGLDPEKVKEMFQKFGNDIPDLEFYVFEL